MATTGYKLDSTATSGGFQPTTAHHLFYTNGYWWLLARDSTEDWFLYKKDQSTPGTPGNAGGWTKITAVEPEVRSTASVAMHWNEANQTLHVLGMHSTASRYQQYSYTAGTDTWSHDVVDESFILPALSGEAADITSDNNNIPVVITKTSANYPFYHRTGGSWGIGFDVEVGGTTASGSRRVTVFPFKDGGGSDYIGAMYSYTGSRDDGWRFAYIPTTANYNATIWTTELAAAPDNGVDDHISAVAWVPSGETDSRIVAAMKNGGDDEIHCVWRDTDGTWSALTQAFSGHTRPKVGVDATNNKVRVMSQYITSDDTDGHYVESDLTDPLSFGTQTTWVEDDGVGDDFTSPGVSQDAYTSTTGWVWVQNGPTDVWWNEETISGGGGGGGAFPGTVAGDGGHVWPARANDPRWAQIITDSGITASGNFQDDVRAALLALSGASRGSPDDLWKKVKAANGVTDTSEPWLY